MEWKYFVTIIFMILLAPGVLGVTVSDVALTYNEAPVRTLGLQPLTGTTFSFTAANVTCTSTCYATLNLGDFVIGAYDRRIELRTCVNDEATYNCTLSGLDITSTDATLDYTINLFTDEFQEITGSLPITLDTTTPVLTKLETSYCDETSCYVGSNARTTVYATFEDDPSSFDYKLVKVNIGGAEGHATHCEGLTCTATIETRPCIDGNPVHVTVTDYAPAMPSSEDALNPVNNEYSITARCDATNPTVTDFKMWSGGTIQTIYETAQPAHFSAMIHDTPGREARVVITSSVSEESYVFPCAETTPGMYLCEDVIADVISGRQTLTFSFEDAVGNRVVETKEILVLESVETPGTDFITLRVNEVQPTPMNRVALQLATENSLNYPFFIDFTLESTEDIRIVNQNLRTLDCVWDDKPLTNDSGRHDLFSAERSYILKPEAGIGEPNRFVMNVHTSAGMLNNTVYARCSYDIYIADGERLYVTPEREEFMIQLRFANSVLGSPGVAFVEEIQRAEKDIDSGLGKAIEKLNKVGSYADTFCGGFYTLAGIDGLATTLQASSVPIVQDIGDVINVPMETVFGLFSDDYRNAKNRQALWTRHNPEGVPSGGESTVGLALLPTEFSIAGMCEWWTCADARESDGFLGKAGGLDGLTCTNINGWLTGENNFDGTPTSDDVPANDESGVLNSLTSYDTLTQGNYCAPQYENSLLTSLGLTGTGFCAKGVLYNLGKWQGIDCGYVSCLKEQSSIGANINVCKQARDFKTCTAVYDEVFELPLVNVMSRTSALVNARTQDAGYNLLNTGLDAYCNPQKNVADTIADELVRTALDTATSGTYSAVMETRALVTRFLKTAKIVPAADAVTKATPTRSDPQRLVCNIKDSITRFSEVDRIRSGGLSFQSADYSNLCVDARCNGDNCDRHGLSDSYLDGIAGYGLLIRGSVQEDIRYGQRSADYLSNVYYDAYSEAYDHAVDVRTSGMEASERKEFNQALGALISATPTGQNPSAEAIDNVVTEYGVNEQLLTNTFSDVSVLPERIVLVRDNEGWFATTTDAEGTFGSESRPLDVSIDKRTAEFLDSYYAGAPLTQEDVQKIRQALEKCTGECSPERVTQMAAGEVVEPEIPAHKLEAGLREGVAEQALKLMEGGFDSAEHVNRANTRIQETCSEKNLVCSIDGGVLKICSDTDRKVCETFRQEELYAYRARDQAMDAMQRLGVDFGTKWLYDQGYLENLKLSSWGDWGAETAARADKLWNPETWKTNLCSAEIEILIDDDPLISLGSSQGPVLTFAAERRLIDETYHYTISYFIRADEENTVWIQTDGQNINWTANYNAGVRLGEEEQLVGGFALDADTAYEELCVVFARPFPDAFGKSRYCQHIVEDAYER